MPKKVYVEKVYVLFPSLKDVPPISYLRGQFLFLFSGRDLLPDLFCFLFRPEGPKPICRQAIWIAKKNRGPPLNRANLGGGYFIYTILTQLQRGLSPDFRATRLSRRKKKSARDPGHQ